jgi:hypothetical protein
MESSNWTIGQLCDLKATEADAETRQLVEDYAVWFANR